MMTDRRILESGRRDELVWFVRPFAQRLDDSRSVDAPSGSCDQIPQKLSKCHAHRCRALKDTTWDKERLGYISRKRTEWGMRGSATPRSRVQSSRVGWGKGSRLRHSS